MVYRLKDAIIACGNEDVNCLREQFRKATGWKGAAGTLTFDDTGVPHAAGAIITAENGDSVYTPLP